MSVTGFNGAGVAWIQGKTTRLMEHKKAIRVLVYGGSGGSGGYVRYCKGLFGSGVVPNDLRTYLVCSPEFLDELRPLDAGINVITHPWPSSSSRLRRYLWHLVIYPRLVHEIRPDVEFYPSGQLRVYLRRATTVATCHNLLLFDGEELNCYGDAQARRNLMQYRGHQARSFQRASGVIFLSDHSRQVVLNQLSGIKRHAVVAHGLDPQFRLPNLRSYAIREKVNLLYVSTIHSYKHHPEVVRAVKEVRQVSGLDVHLRVVGGASPSALRELEATLCAEKADGYVDIVGQVNRDALLREYGEADLFVFASSCETFGIVLLEAMGARLPIACSDRTGLPDILKDAGVYFDPAGCHSIASAIMQLLANPDKMRTLGEKAYEYSKEYTWARCAQQTFEFIQQIHESCDVPH